MKKFLPILAFALICLVGCTKVNEVTGNYKEGTYFGAKEYESYGVKYVTTATIYVGSDGMIKTCFIDSTYTKDSVNTTKKTLGDAYGMKSASASAGNIPGGA